jgi:hypothetical protein
VAQSEDPTGIESALRNASLDGCNEGLLVLQSFADDVDDEG